MTYKRRAASLSGDQLQLLQAFIDDLAPGVYDAMDIVAEGYVTYFSPAKVHGAQFYAAVKAGHLKRVSYIEMDRGTKHLRYQIGPGGDRAAAPAVQGFSD